MKVKYIMSLVLVKPRNEHERIMMAYSLSCWIVFRLRDDFSWLVGGNSKYYKSFRWDSSSLNRQKSYAKQWHRPPEFQVDDKVFLRVSPTRAVMRLWNKGK